MGHNPNDQATLGVVLLKEGAQLPAYQSNGAAGLDLHACCEAPLTLEPGEWGTVPTGIALMLPPGHEGQVRPRSGLARKHAVTVLNAPGTIDEDYRGEVQVLLINHGNKAFVVQHGERIAQLVVAPVTRVSATLQSALPETERGVRGFGSTGR